MLLSSQMRTYVLSVAITIVVVTGFVLYHTFSKQRGPTIRVLFIGNSFTSVNNLPQMVAGLAKSRGDRLEYDMAAPGGYKFSQHVQDQATLNKIKSNLTSKKSTQRHLKITTHFKH